MLVQIYSNCRKNVPDELGADIDLGDGIPAAIVRRRANRPFR